MSNDKCPTCGQKLNKITYGPGEYIEYKDPNGTFIGFVAQVMPNHYKVLSHKRNFIERIEGEPMICQPVGEPMSVVWVNKHTMESEKVMDINGNMLPVTERKLS